MKTRTKNFILLTVSTLLSAVGIYFFKFANNFTFGGITGLAVLIAKTGVISASDFSFVANILLLIIGWINLRQRQHTARFFYLLPSRHWSEFIL